MNNVVKFFEGTILKIRSHNALDTKNLGVRNSYCQETKSFRSLGVNEHLILKQKILTKGSRGIFFINI